MNILVPDIFSRTMEKVRIETGFDVNFQFGQNIQILTSLKNKDKSVSLKNTKYPLFALHMPYKEDYGREYINLLVRRMTIANLVNGNDTPEKRFEDGGNFKSILYPVWESFIKFFVRDTQCVVRGVDELVFTKEDICPIKALGEGVIDVVDCIEVTNFQTKLKEIKTC